MGQCMADGPLSDIHNLSVSCCFGQRQQEQADACGACIKVCATRPIRHRQSGFFGYNLTDPAALAVLPLRCGDQSLS
jgi:hypothetical protein